MYDAMSAAINMIHPDSIDVEARAIVTFTDGHDNLSTSTANDIISSLLTNSIKSYTMGLDGEQWGGVDSDILDQLALVTHEQGESYIVNSIEDLSEAFYTFAKSVSNVYKVTYRRNNQQIIDPLQFKFILNCY